MEVSNCGACPHPAPLHVGGRGRCRLNGCPCTAFVEPLRLTPAPASVVVAPLPSRQLAAIVLPPAVAFIAGLVLGIAGR